MANNLRLGNLALVVLTVAMASATVAPAAGGQGVAPKDSAALVRAVVQAESQFYARWRSVWTAVAGRAITRVVDSAKKNPPGNSLQDRLDPVLRLENKTFWDGHCHAEADPRSTRPKRIIVSATGQYQCPNWIGIWRAIEIKPDTISPALEAFDANFLVLPVLHAVVRDSLQRERNSLVKLIDSASSAIPGDVWTAGQRVRIRADVDDWDGALQVARDCRANRWWCSSLVGYVLRERGEWLAADSAFAVATSAVGGDARCQWVDFRAILDEVGKPEYAKGSCAQRDSLSKVMMWLSDPLFSEPGNERRVDQFARHVFLFLRGALPRDELYNWSPSVGGDALTETIRRYGRPARIQWLGPAGNIYHEEDYLGKLHRTYWPGTPYITAEYPRESTHLVPRWNAIADPFRARSDAWTISSDSASWWPIEHAWIGRKLVQINDEQSGFLRRDSTAVLAYATDLAMVDLGQHAGDTLTALVLRSPRPDSIERHATQRVGGKTMLRTRAAVPSTPAVIGVEVTKGPAQPVARTRFGVIAPPPLVQIARGDAAMSDILLLQAPMDDAPLPNEPNAAFARMLGTTRLGSGTKKVGVYWEVYGYASGDSVEIAVRIQRFSSQGAMAGVAIALNIWSDRNAPVTASWSEPTAGHGAHTTPGVIPIVSRSMVLDIGALTPGDYWLDIAVRKPGTEPVTSRRVFSIGM